MAIPSNTSGPTAPKPAPKFKALPPSAVPVSTVGIKLPPHLRIGGAVTLKGASPSIQSCISSSVSIVVTNVAEQCITAASADSANDAKPIVKPISIAAIPTISIPALPTVRIAALPTINIVAPVLAKYSVDTLLKAMWRGDRIYQLGSLDRQTTKFKNFHVKDIPTAVTCASALSETGKEAYFACAEYLSANSRIADNVSGAWGFWLDIDCGKDKADSGKGYINTEVALQALTKFCNDAGLPIPTHHVDSGGGLHVYFALKGFVDRATWQKYASKIKALTKALGFLADDSRTSDIASVLRMPGTLNFKYDPPRPVTLIYASNELIDNDIMFAAIDVAHGKYCPATDTKVATSTTAYSNVNCDFDGQYSSYSRKYSTAEIRAMVNLLDPDMEYGDWTKIAMAIHHVTGGSDDGFDIFDAWSGRGSKYKGIGESKSKWRSFKTDRVISYNIGTIINMLKAKGFDWKAVCAEAEEPFEQCQTTVVPYVQKSHAVAKASTLSQGTTEQVVAAPVVIPAKADTTTDSAKDNTKAKAEARAYFMGALAAMQMQYALIMLNGKFYGFDQIRLATPDEKGKAQPLELSIRMDTNLLLERSLYANFPQAKTKVVIDTFWVSPQTRCYTGVDFDPTGTSGNKLNLWVGPTIIAKVGRWELIRGFLLDVICSGDQGHYQYLVCYIAHALQRPGEKPGVMIILLGGQGNGKGTLARILNRIWGATFLQVSKSESITGNFNAVLERTYIVFMDEALFAGDHKASDTLKSLVTEPVIHINEKFQAARQTASYHRFFVGSNADHLKNTDRDDRRDFPLRVSEARHGDFVYWSALYSEIANGGVEAMVHDLLAMDLSGFNVRAKPNTKELLQQKLLSLKEIPRWWYDCLYSGDLSIDGDWPDFISTEEAIEDIWKMCGGRGYKKPNGNDLVDALLKLCPSVSKGQKKGDGLSRKRGYSLPPLVQARAEFDKYIGGAVNWPEVTSGYTAGEP